MSDSKELGKRRGRGMTEKRNCSTCEHVISQVDMEPCKRCLLDFKSSMWQEIEIMKKEIAITTLNEYQQATARTDSHTSHREAVLNFALGIAGEAGEIVDLVKKRMFHGHAMDKEKLKGELGDQLWYISRMAARFDITLEEVAQGNIDKLKHRYPDGFDKQKSINRSVD
jgi:NTP pyrophosphatase (non-canonical NTP hydrolase)